MPSKLAAWLAAHPRSMVAGAALAGTLVAVHPLLLGRSLATPNTGGAMVLYDTQPFVPGSTDAIVEDARGTDVGAMAWAILPYTVVQRTALASGEWPLWNRYNLGGVPLWGQAQTFALDPFHIASLLVPDALLAMDLRFIVARLVFAAGIGLLVLALTGSAGAGALMALVTPFIGIYAYRLNHPAYFSLTWTPWVLLAYPSLIRARDTAASARAAVGMAIASYLQLVGSTPKEGVVALAAVHAAGAAGLFLARRRWSERLAALDSLALTAAAIVLATAPHWLVFVDGLTRAFTIYDRPGAYFLLWPQIAAYLLGAATPGLPYPAVHALGAALAVAALVMGLTGRGGRPHGLREHAPSLSATRNYLPDTRAGWQPLTVGCLLALVLLSAVAVGLVPESLLTRLPFVANIHHIGLTSAAATIPLVLVLAGTGAAALMDPSTSRWRLVAAVVVVAILAFLLARSLPGEALSPHRLMALYSLAAAVMVVLLLPLARYGARVAWAVGMAAGIGASVMAGGLTLDTDIALVEAALTQPRPRADLQVVPPALQPVIAAQNTGDPFRVAPYGLVMMAGTQAYWGLEAIGGPDAVRLPWIEDLSDLSGVTRTPFIWLTDLNKGNLDVAQGFLDLMNVRYLVSRPDNLPPGTTPMPAPAPARLAVVERPTAWPRAFFVDGVERHDSLFTFVDRLAAADGPFASADRTEPAAMAAVSSLPEHATVVRPARDYDLTVNRTSFRIDATGPGVAALSESFVDLDFVATLNGTPVPYFRLNHAFKGIVIPSAGEWEVTFEYRPASWRLSWLMAAAGWLLVAGLAVAGWRKGVRDGGAGRK